VELAESHRRAAQGAMSHGCIRLTNWDAKKLAAMVDKGTVVDFLG
jgi:lipoprotein-anchoring transpeptidase ErfK/SrfK